MYLGKVVFFIVSSVFLLLVVTFAVAPVVIGASVSLTGGDFLAFPPEGFSWRWYKIIFEDVRWREAFYNSFVIAGMCTIVATVLGTLTAYGIALMSNRLLRLGLVVLFILPLAVPHMSLAMALYPLFARIGLVGSKVGVALAQALYALPLVVLAVLAVIRRSDLQLERAARSLGAGPFEAFHLVVLPLLSSGIAVGGVISFMTSLDDVTAPIFLSGSTAGTLPKMMLDSLALNSDPSVMAASTVVALLGLVLFTLGSLLSKRSK